MKRYVIQPLQHGMLADFPDLHTPQGFSPDAQNVKVEQHSIKNRFGLSTADRNFGSAVAVLNIILYQLKGGTRYTVYLTDTNACKKETASSKTWKYITEEYATGNVSDISSVTVTGSGTTWTSAMVGDYFVLDEDLTDDEEPDSSWREISAASATSLTLSTAYQKDISSTSKSYHIRRVYSTPTNEKWAYASVDDKLCFGNGNTNVQYWTGSNYATDLDSTYAVKARYMIEFANRLILADLGSTRDPYLLRTSNEGDPTSFDTTTTAADYAFIETDDYITGLGKAASYLYVFKEESVIIGHRTSVSTDPLAFATQKKGTGCIAPYSITHARGACMWLGNHDFYYISGNEPRMLSKDKMRYKFFDIVSPTEAKNTWAYTNYLENEVQFIANTSEGKYAFVLNLLNDEWNMCEYAVDLIGAGKGHK